MTAGTQDAKTALLHAVTTVFDVQCRATAHENMTAAVSCNSSMLHTQPLPFIQVHTHAAVAPPPHAPAPAPTMSMPLLVTSSTLSTKGWSRKSGPPMDRLMTCTLRAMA